MVKAIVKINAIFDKRREKEVYDLIYNQLKAGLEVITVPACCDVYILDGADVEVQKEEKGCPTCKHVFCLATSEPCYSCIHGYCTENPNRTERWEAKNDNT